MTASNESWAARRMAAVPRGVGNATQIYAAKAENAEVWDVEGKRYIDFAGGIAVLNTGHKNPKVMARVEAQLQRFTHTCFQVMPYDSYIELAERINTLAPGKFDKKTIFLTTGAEAIENAVKIARAATGRSAIISFAGGFHGRTMMTLALTGKVAPYKIGFGPFPPEVFHLPFPSEFQGISEKESLAALDRLFKADVEPKRVAAIVIEPVQGEGGFNVAPFGFLRELRKRCDEHGILLIADEVQTGFGRTGKMFAIEHSGVAPDLIAMAKSLAGGFPLSGVVGRAEIMDAVPAGGLGGTYGGNPLACAAGLGVLEAIEEDGLLARSEKLGQRLKERFEAMQRSNRIPCIGEVRGLGAMVALELVKDRTSKEPAPDLTKAVVTRAADKGLIVLSCGTNANVIRILVPLTASDALVDEGVGILEGAFLDALAA
jgi:4-aminobutyrate aminotransferase / (S)-3-amino-2-methylpropionate transaminase / 5-aminovalerate transaminase